MFQPSYPQFISYKPKMSVPEGEYALRHFCFSRNLASTELYADDLVPRDQPLFRNKAERDQLAARLRGLCGERIHCSYWAWMTSFLAKAEFDTLVRRFGGEAEVVCYYGDLTGEHLYSRWCMEYELAAIMGAAAYTFHLIDYAPVDGLWRYTLSRDEILRAMVTMLQTLLDRLDEGGLLSADSPVIEVENAGWGLEYGMQTAEDFTFLFDQLNDRHGKVRVAWDLNHLLHAVGADTAAGRACFFLPGDEVSPDMKALEERLGDQPEQFAQAWIERNLLHPATACRTGCVHLSDCVMKETEFFRRGRLIEPYASELDALPDVDAKEQYGVRFVLTYYDSHVPLGSGILTGRAIAGLLDALAAANPGFSLLHELKNATDLPGVLDMQLKSLCQTEKQPSA